MLNTEHLSNRRNNRRGRTCSIKRNIFVYDGKWTNVCIPCQEHRDAHKRCKIRYTFIAFDTKRTISPRSNSLVAYSRCSTSWLLTEAITRFFRPTRSCYGQTSNAYDVPLVTRTADSCILFSFHGVSRLLSLVRCEGRRADLLPKRWIPIVLIVICIDSINWSLSLVHPGNWTAEKIMCLDSGRQRRIIWI